MFLRVSVQQNFFEKTLMEVGSSHLYSSFGTFCFQIGPLFEALEFYNCTNQIQTNFIILANSGRSGNPVTNNPGLGRGLRSHVQSCRSHSMLGPSPGWINGTIQYETSIGWHAGLARPSNGWGYCTLGWPFYLRLPTGQKTWQQVFKASSIRLWTGLSRWSQSGTI